MKNLSKFLFVTLFAYAFSACSSNQIELPDSESRVEAPATIENEEINAADINPQSIQSDAKEHFNLLKRTILATGSHLPQTRSSEVSNPFYSKLAQLVLVDDEAKNGKISFHSLCLDEQLAFLEDWMVIQAKNLSDKLSVRPDLLDYVKQQNEIFATTLNEELLQTRSASEERVKDNTLFFNKLQDRLYALQNPKESSVTTRTVAKIDAPKIDPYTVIGALKNHSRVGDIMVTIPSYNRPWVYANLGENSFTVGHGAIIVDKVNRRTTPKDKVTLGSNIGYGVIMEEIEYWAVQSYIMGIQIVSWKKDKSALVGLAKKRWTKVVKPLEADQRKQLVQKAKEFEGRPYVRIEEFPFAKHYAPLRFTCTCLIWYCCMELFDIDISPIWSPVVSPSDVYLSEHTYVRARISE